MLTSHAHRHSVDHMLGWLLYDQASVQYRQKDQGFCYTILSSVYE